MNKKNYFMLSIIIMFIAMSLQAQNPESFSEDFTGGTSALTLVDNSEAGAYSFNLVNDELMMIVDKSLGAWSGAKLVFPENLNLSNHPYMQIKLRTSLDVSVGIGFVDDSGYDLNRTYVDLVESETHSTYYLNYTSWDGLDWGNGGANVVLNPEELVEIHMIVEEGGSTFQDTIFIDEIILGSLVDMPTTGFAEDFTQEPYLLEWFDNSGDTEAYTFNLANGELTIDINKSNDPPTNWGGFFINSVENMSLSGNNQVNIRAKTSDPAHYWIQIFDENDNYLSDYSLPVLATDDFVEYRFSFNDEITDLSKKLLIIPAPGTSAYHDASIVIDEFRIGDAALTDKPTISSSPVGVYSNGRITSIPPNTEASVLYNGYSGQEVKIIKGANIYTDVAPADMIENGMVMYVIENGIVSDAISLELENERATYIETPIAIDGEESDAGWALSDEYPIALVTVGSISQDSDLSANYKVLWDDEALYFFVDVKDDVKINDSDDTYHDDSVEIFIDLDNSKGTSFDGLNDYHFAFRWDDTEVHENSFGITDGIEFVMSGNSDGYTFEVKFPWTSIEVPGEPYAPQAGNLIGFNVQVNDDDDGGDRDAVIASHDANNQAWTDPSVFGTLVLGQATSVSNFIKAPTVSVFPNPINNIVTVSAREEIQSLRVLNITGQVVISVESINSTDYQIDLSDLKAGIYIVDAMFRNGAVNMIKVTKN